jgi:hypothetical protein
MTTDRVTALLGEYQVCQQSVQSLEATVWQSATAMGLVSIGTLALAATSDATVPTILLLVVFSTAGAVFCWRLAIRWWSILHAKLQRMLHIEEDLDLPGQSHYIVFLNDLHSDGSSAPRPQDPRISALAKEHSIPLKRAHALAQLEYNRKGPREVLWAFPLVTGLIWFLYLVLQILPVVLQAFTIAVITLPIGISLPPGT